MPFVTVFLLNLIAYPKILFFLEQGHGDCMIDQVDKYIALLRKDI